MMKKIISALAFGILVSSCASSWTLVSKENTHIRLSRLSLTIPDGWVFYNNHFNEYTAVVNGHRVDKKVKRVVVTRDGLNLDVIDIIEFDSDNAFPSLERKSVQKSTLPSELAELFIAEQKTTLGINNLQVVKSEPVIVAGQKGFSVRLRFKSKSGLQMEQVACGILTANKFYTFKFTAPSLYYFETNLPEFETLVKSVTVNS